jgi:hypothetical protein
MKCKFEHDGDCCNSGATQYMCKCKQPCDTIIPVTNADRIRAMSDEELAKWIDWLFGRCEWCDTDKMATDDCNDVECTPCIVEWLQQPAEVDNG